MEKSNRIRKVMLLLLLLLNTGSIGVQALYFLGRSALCPYEVAQQRQTGYEKTVYSGSKYEEGMTDPALSMDPQVKYVLYIGLNDKDTYEQRISTEEARRLVDEICIRHVDGYTVTKAQGGWKDEKNVLTQENTLIYSFRNVREAQIKEIMNQVMRTLNQGCILVEKGTAEGVYYYGEKGEETNDQGGK